MAKRSKSKVNKSQAIRDYINGDLDAAPKDVSAALAAQGVTVTAAFVSTLKSNDKRKGGKAARRGRPPGAAKSAGMDVNSLIQAKQLADKMGGIAQAQQALAALAKILGK